MMCLRQKQADDEIYGDQPLDFLVSTLDKEVPLSLVNSAEISGKNTSKLLSILNGFYDSKCLTLPQTHSYICMTPMIR
jgi:hypothetical protein